MLAAAMSKSFSDMCSVAMETNQSGVCACGGRYIGEVKQNGTEPTDSRGKQ